MFEKEQLNRIDYLEKLSESEKEWLKEFDLSFRKKRYKSDDAYVATIPFRTVGHKVEDFQEYVAPDFTTPEDFLLVKEFVQSGQEPVYISRNWKISPTFRDRNTVARESLIGYCKLSAKRGRGHPLSGIYGSMLDKCYNPNSRLFRLHGAKGIRVCGRWFYSFDAFVEDIGELPSVSVKLCRTDPSKNYEPGNVHWEFAPYVLRKFNPGDYDIAAIRQEYYIEKKSFECLRKQYKLRTSHLKQILKVK